MTFNQNTLNKNKVLILCRDPEQKGGVTNYCNSLFQNYESNDRTIERFIIGRRPGKTSNFYYFFTLLNDYIRFFFLLQNKTYDLVHVNPSLGIVSLLRDSIFLIITRFKSVKMLVFWHGWDNKTESLIESNRTVLTLFKIIYGKANIHIVLASSFKEKLIDWGIQEKIYVETTSIDDGLIEYFSLAEKLKKNKYSENFQLLFFSRIERSKGIIETIDAFTTLRQIGKNLTLVIAGNGPDYNLMKAHIKKTGENNIKLVGFVSGEKKKKILEKSHILCLPTFYGEGLPVSILECMAFGLPIITCPVGGIRDNFQEGENGYYVQPRDSHSLAEILKKVISDKDRMERISINNYHYARNHFLSSIVSKRLDNIYKKVINE